jgi:methyl-accepting chemotaxis protein
MADSMRGVDDSLKEAALLARERRAKADALSALVSEGADKAADSNESMRSIAKDVGKIEEVVAIIESVAGSTNLLAMNAAIEAAHAGEAGKGFAVVADEIRKLADAAAENAHEIAFVLRSITDRVGNALSASEDGYRSFREIEGVAADFTAALGEIAEKTASVARVSDGVFADAKGLAEDAERIRINADAMKTFTGEAAALMEGLNGAADQAADAIGEISSGTADLVSAMDALSSQVAVSRDRTGELNAALDAFVLTSDAC